MLDALTPTIRWILLAAILLAARPAPPRVTALGRWVLMDNGQPAPIDDFVRGLQTSGLAWDGKLLWSIGDQRSTFPGCLFAIDARTAWLDRPPVPLVAEGPDIKSQLAAWGRLDAEGIDVLSRAEHRFVVLLEQNATAALVVRVDDSGHQAIVEAIWNFEFPNGQVPVPYRNDPNFRLEGIALDPSASRGFVGYERDKAGRPRLYQFDLGQAPKSGIGKVALQPLPFCGWEALSGKPNALPNVNGLEFTRTANGDPRLFVLCRDREMFFVLDPDSGKLIGQVELDLRSPGGAPIEWASPEGIAIDPQRGVVYIVSDPDSTDGNWRLRSTPKADGFFGQYLPLLFELKIPGELLR